MPSEKFKETEIGVMPEEWDFMKFGSILKGGTRNGVYKSKEFHGTGVKIVNMGELFANPRLYSIPMKRINLTDKELELSSLEEGDLLFARRSLVAEGAGKCTLICEIEEPTTFESSIIRVRPNSEKAVSTYLYYFFNSPRGEYLLDTIRRQVAVAGITGSDLVKLNIPLPSLDEQNSIAKIFIDLDQKIELNNQMNQTLESIGKAIFKHWFVDFEFPDENGNPYKSSGGEMIDSELGEIPVGWEISDLKDFGKVICGKTPPKSKHEYFKGKVPFIKIPDMHGQTFVVKTGETLSQEGKEYQKNKTIPPKSICVSCIATVGLVCINDKESQTNQQINSIIPNYDYLTPFLYFKLSSMKDFLKILASGGSATLNLNTKNFSNIKIANPESFIMKNYYNLINPLFEAILINSQENKYLSKIRDSLLPKLMSGKIRVNIPEEVTAK